MTTVSQSLTIPNVPAQDVTDVFAIQLRPRTADGRAGTHIYGGTRPELHGCIHNGSQITRYTDIEQALNEATRRQNGSAWDFYVIPHPDGPSQAWRDAHAEAAPAIPEDLSDNEAMDAAIAAMRQRWEADIARIGERFGAEAVRRGWCGDYERVLNDLNDDLEFPIPGRPRRWEVYFPQTVTLRVQINQQVRNIMAETREAATEQGRTQAANLDAVRALVLAALPGLSDRVVRNLLTSMDQVQPREGSQPEVYES